MDTDPLVQENIVYLFLCPKGNCFSRIMNHSSPIELYLESVKLEIFFLQKLPFLIIQLFVCAYTVLSYMKQHL